MTTPPPTTYRVLLVEDDPADARIVTRLLTAQPDQVRVFELRHAWRLSEALERVAEHEFDVVLCDVHLPDRGGPEVIEALVTRVPDVPVVALTGHDDDALGLESIAAGAEAYLTKDRIDAIGLRRTLAHTFARVRERRRQELAIARAHQQELAALNEALRQEAEQRARAQARLEERGRELERSNRDLHEFAQVASHDLKSPLQAVARLVEWLSDDLAPVADEASRAHLAQLKRRVARMLRLLDDVLAWARVGGHERPPEEVDTAELIAQTWDALDGSERFEFVVEGELPRLVTHREPFALVFRNLLANAIKHHDRASGRVELGYRETARGHCFHVRDDGPGIPEALHERVFKLFGVGRPDAESSGVGLAMVRRAVAELGGDVELSSGPGRGTTFTVTWP